MVGGIGPCRFGYYAEIQKMALKEAGFDGFDFVTLEPPGAGWRDFISTIKSLAPGSSHYSILQNIRDCFNKAIAIDFLEAKALKVRAFEVNRGDTGKALKKATEAVRDVSKTKDLETAKESGLRILDQVEQDPDHRPLKIALVGEFYLVIEPFFKFGIERWMGERGILVERSVYLTDWIRPSGENPVTGMSNKEIADAARPYLKHTVGGDGLASIGHTVGYAKEGFDGIIHLLPFTCMPDTIAKAMLGKVSEDHDIPALSLVIDELTGKAGVMTRLEAFIDLVKSRAEKKAVCSA
jgi:predicted nucleotide-binding protein (sugar kinase/HSP70/actin superfamily)